MKNKIFAVTMSCCLVLASAICTGLARTDDDTLGFCGSGTFVSQTETLTYSRKETVTYSISSEVPDYGMQVNYCGCANVAGAIIIGYYDRFCEELIPNYKAYVQIGPVIKYFSSGDAVPGLIASLYSLMGTDTVTGGTTYDGFQNGMKSYVSSHGYSYSITDLGNLDFAKYKTAVENNKPVALFLTTYSFLTGTTASGSQETIKSDYCAVAHVSVGCGYRVDTYYDASNRVLATRTYLKIASGFPEYGITYLCLDGKSSIYKATAVTIQ